MLLSGGLLFTSILKFVDLIFIESTRANISLGIFFLVIDLLIIVIIFLAKTYWDANRKTTKLYRELLDAHIQLEGYARDIKAMASYEERNRIARD